MTNPRRIEYTVAVTSFVVAVALAVVSLYLDDQHEVAAGNCTLVAQFLILTASIFGIDYKLNSYGTTSKRNSQQQPAQHSTQHAYEVGG